MLANTSQPRSLVFFSLTASTCLRLLHHQLRQSSCLHFPWPHQRRSAAYCPIHWREEQPRTDCSDHWRSQVAWQPACIQWRGSITCRGLGWPTRTADSRDGWMDSISPPSIGQSVWATYTWAVCYPIQPFTWTSKSVCVGGGIQLTLLHTCSAVLNRLWSSYHC